MQNTFYKHTKLIGLIGHPIKQSYSPFIHNIASQLKQVDYIYLPFDVVPDNLENAANGIVALGIEGMNITIPHKEKIMSYLDDRSEESAIIGAVNTVINDNGKLVGFNTDVHGILETLNPYKDKISGQRVSVIGAGGGARALIYTLIRHYRPGEINIINRTLQRADSLRNYFEEKLRYNNFHTFELFPPELVDTLNSSELIVNCNPIGLFPDVDDTPTDLEQSFKKDQIVFDMIYNPGTTKLMQIAGNKGAITIGGLNMLVHQAAKSFELWTGKEIPVDKLTRSLMLMISK
ncbi:MAG: shikimate dehydrogenase [Ignavibacteria bacterium]|jgi:shikimate dehydrogenase